MQTTAFLTNSLTGGGAERAINQVVNELFDRKLPVSLIVCNESKDDFVKVRAKVFKLKRRWKSGILLTLFSIIRLNWILYRNDIKVLILNCDLPELLGFFSLRKVKLIVVEHVNRPWINRKFLGRIIRRGLRIRGASFVAVSNFLKIWPFDTFPKKVMLNPIPMDNFELNDLGEASGIEVKRLVFIGRLAEQKRPEWILDIAKLTNLPVIFIGEGQLKDSLKISAQNRGLDAKFIGQITDPWSVCNQNDLVVIPSQYEGDGLVVLEAILNNRPFLLSDIKEFRRFDLPRYFYCNSEEEFSNRVDEFRFSIEKLITSADKRKILLSERRVEIISDEWEIYLEAIS